MENFACGETCPTLTELKSDFFFFFLLAWVEIVSSKRRLGHNGGFSAYRINQKRVIAGAPHF